jgi:hypothetical protein
LFFFLFVPDLDPDFFPDTCAPWTPILKSEEVVVDVLVVCPIIKMISSLILLRGCFPRAWRHGERLLSDTQAYSLLRGGPLGQLEQKAMQPHAEADR